VDGGRKDTRTSQCGGVMGEFL